MRGGRTESGGYGRSRPGGLWLLSVVSERDAITRTKLFVHVGAGRNRRPGGRSGQQETATAVEGGQDRRNGDGVAGECCCKGGVLAIVCRRLEFE